MKEACEVCSGTQSRTLFSKDGYDFLRCGQCGHVYTPIALDDRQLTEMYEKEFFESGGYADYLADENILRMNFRRFITILKPFCPSGKMLEIGCAYGFFLDCARIHWQAEGIDISARAVSHARQQLGVQAQEGDFLRAPLPQVRYDAVVLWDTIEHLRHPSGYVAKASRLLRPGGILALTTGDGNSLAAKLQGKGWRLYYPPYHLHYFSARTLSLLLDRYGLHPVHITHVGYYRSTDMILHRLLNDRKPAVFRGLYRLAKRAGIAGRRAVYLNLYDILLMVARKEP